jgi:hypothetical protein
MFTRESDDLDDILGDILEQAELPDEPGDGGAGGSGGGGGGVGSRTREELEQAKDELKKILEMAGAASRLGQFAADAIARSTIDPLKRELEEIDKLLRPGFIDLYARDKKAELEEQRAAAAERVAEAERKILAFRQQQERLQFLEQQIGLLKLIRDNALDADDILGGLTLGINANMEEVLEAMTRAMQRLVSRAEDELGIASESKKFMDVGKWSVLGVVKGIEQHRRQLEMAMRSLTPSMSSPAGRPGIPSFQAAAGPGMVIEHVDVNLPIENINSLIDVESLAYRVADVLRRRQP